MSAKTSFLGYFLGPERADRGPKIEEYVVVTVLSQLEIIPLIFLYRLCWEKWL